MKRVLSPPGYVFHRGFYICQLCCSLLPDDWTLLLAHNDWHDWLKELERKISRDR